VAGIFSLLAARLDWPTLHRPSRCVVVSSSEIAPFSASSFEGIPSPFLFSCRGASSEITPVARRTAHRQRSGQTRSQLPSILIYLLHLPCAHVAISICIRERSASRHQDELVDRWRAANYARFAALARAQLKFSMYRATPMSIGLSSWPVNSR